MPALNVLELLDLIEEAHIDFILGHSHNVEQADALQPIRAAEFDSVFDAPTAPIGE
jgi:hypothetical protein